MMAVTATRDLFAYSMRPFDVMAPWFTKHCLAESIVVSTLTFLIRLIIVEKIVGTVHPFTEVAELKLPIKDLGYLHGPTQPYELELGHAPERTETRVYMDILVGHELR